MELDADETFLARLTHGRKYRGLRLPIVASRGYPAKRGNSMFVQFTIPRGTVELGRIIDTCVARCVERWGGCTVTDGLGYWNGYFQSETDPDNTLVPGFVEVEPVAILNIECEPQGGRWSGRYGPNWTEIVRGWFDNLAAYVRERGKQHTVYYRMFDGGEARFVGPNTIVALPHGECPTCRKSHPSCTICGQPTRCPQDEPGEPFAWCDECDAKIAGV